MCSSGRICPLRNVPKKPESKRGDRRVCGEAGVGWWGPVVPQCVPLARAPAVAPPTSLETCQAPKGWLAHVRHRKSSPLHPTQPSSPHDD
uniref:Uncharacterized protein n=1 Tax=Knipowitschia caucasica TaxID=637954 RepID=A0AAV2JS72_KNICA